MIELHRIQSHGPITFPILTLLRKKTCVSSWCIVNNWASRYHLFSRKIIYNRFTNWPFWQFLILSVMNFWWILIWRISVNCDRNGRVVGTKRQHTEERGWIQLKHLIISRQDLLSLSINFSLPAGQDSKTKNSHKLCVIERHNTRH
jgi:hypothetical protein